VPHLNKHNEYESGEAHFPPKTLHTLLKAHISTISIQNSLN